jgi:hypothetical protein
MSDEDNGGDSSTVDLLEIWSNAAQEKLVALGVASELLPPAPAQTPIHLTTTALAHEMIRVKYEIDSHVGLC